MSKPGTFHTVVAGDRIRAIARTAYGYDRSSDIVTANDSTLSGRAISLEGLPTIYRGDSLWLPAVKEEFSESIPYNADEEIRIRLDGQIFEGWTAVNIQRSINTIADGFTFSLPYNPEDEELREKTRPYSYLTADLFIGDELYISGQCTKWSNSASPNDTKKTIDVRSLSGTTIECMAQASGYERYYQKLSEISTEILKPYGSDLEPVFLNGDSDQFVKVRKEMTDTDFGFLAKLAAQKGFLITSTTDGKLAFLRAELSSKPVFSFVEGETAIEHISSTYDGQVRFSTFQAITQSPGAYGATSKVDDESIPVYRPFVFSADDVESGGLETACKWKKSKSLADSATVSITITGWRNGQGMLWRENMLGTLQAPSIDIHSETQFLISSVQLRKDENGGNISTLGLVLPQAYTLDFPDSFPWEG